VNRDYLAQGFVISLKGHLRILSLNASAFQVSKPIRFKRLGRFDLAQRGG
jgi:hypothetical protein